MKIYSIRDKRVNTYGPLMLFEHVAECTRRVEEWTNDPQTNLCKWPLDYQLDQLGEFDIRTGTFVHDQKEICQIMDLKKVEQRFNNVPVDPVEPQRGLKNVN